ncbi:MAG: signal peptidase I [Pseudonocardiaceae bacterium]
MSAGWHIGNAADDGRNTRGWLLGHFIDRCHGVRSTKDVEIKWGVHPAGETRPEWTSDDQRTTLVLLVEGNFVVNLTEGRAELTRQGDYAVWGPGIDHSWEARENSVVITVRWPSLNS